MNPRIVKFPGIMLAGKKVSMSMVENTTFDLWRSFMPEKNKIPFQKGENLYSMERYPEGYFEKFMPSTVFEKWAAIEVSEVGNLPEKFEFLTVPEGEYAVFIHKGPDSMAPKTYAYIFREWLPVSEYVIDHRPHFAIMGEKYNRESMDSEEEIWVPVKKI